MTQTWKRKIISCLQAKTQRKTQLGHKLTGRKKWRESIKVVLQMKKDQVVLTVVLQDEKRIRKRN